MSGQELSEIQIVGLGRTLISPVGPAKKYRQYVSSMALNSLLFFPNSILAVRMKENSSLCFSNKDLQTFSYRE